MRFLSVFALLVMTATAAWAAKPASAPAPAAGAKSLKFSFKNAEIADVIAAYAKVSGQKFVIDPSVRGRTTIIAPGDVSIDEAFSLLSDALATNQFAILEKGDEFIVTSARNAQRSLVPVVTELPPLKPERLITMIFTPKNISAEEINKRLRILPSKDGELTPFGDKKLIVTDWTSNVHRIAKVIGELDQPGNNFPGAKDAAPAPHPTGH